MYAPLRLLMLTYMFLFSFGLVVAAMAQETEKDEIKYPVEMATFELVLRGEGKPLTGASVLPYAMRCLENKGSHFGWPVGNVGKATPIVTDENGIAKIPYPIRFGREPDWLTTCQLSLFVTHPDFIGKEFHLDIVQGEAAKAEGSLEPGCEVLVSAVDESGKPIDFGVVMTSRGGGAKWTSEDGFRRSRSIPSGTYPAMLAAPQENGVTLFSGVIPLRLSEKATARIRNVPLKKGIVFRGKLPDDVPRPVLNGHVSVEIRPTYDAAGQDPDRIFWNDWTEIKEDGTFEFRSLPSTGTMRVIAMCSGWVIESKAPDNFITGVDIELEDSVASDGVLEYEIPMEPTGDLEVTVITPEGDPLPNAKVSTWPNMMTLSGGSTILGSAYSTSDIIRSQLKIGAKDPDMFWGESSKTTKRFFGETDEDGVVVLHDIPLKRNEGLSVDHDDYGVPNPPEGNTGFRSKSYRIDEKGLKKLIVETEKLKK